MRPIQLTLGPYDGADTDYLATSQSRATAGDLTLTDTLVLAPATFPTITSDANDSTRTYTITGQNNSSQDISVALAGPNSGTSTATLAFASIDSISVAGGGTVGNVSAGISQGGSTDWIPLDIYPPNQVTTISVTVTGTVNYSVVYTNEDPFQSSFNPTEVAHPVAALTGAVANQTGSTTTLMRAIKIKMNSGSGSVRATITQQSTA